MDLHLRGKRAVVTGSSRGIGRAIAAALLAEGCRVFLNGRNFDALAVAARELGGNTEAFAGDVADPEVARRFAAAVQDKWGGLDLLVCNVGSGRSVAPGD